MSTVMREGTAALEKVLMNLRTRQNVEETMMALFADLAALRQHASVPEWRVCAANDCRDHPRLFLLYQDPFVRGAFDKPRGYPGDAQVLDSICVESGSSETPTAAILLS